MKALSLILVITIFACNGSTAKKQPGNDSAAPQTDTPLQPTDTTAAKPPKDTTTLGGNWFLQPVLTSDTATGRIPRLNFDLRARRFNGNTGCNSMSGTFEVTDTSLSFNRQIITTKMACTGYNEKAFLENLLRANRYRLESGILILMFNQTELSRWTRKVAPKPVSNKA